MCCEYAYGAPDHSVAGRGGLGPRYQDCFWVRHWERRGSRNLCGSGCGETIVEGTAVVKGCGVLVLAAGELEVEATGSRPSWGLKEFKFSCMLATNKMPGQGGCWNAL